MSPGRWYAAGTSSRGTLEKGCQQLLRHGQEKSKLIWCPWQVEASSQPMQEQEGAQAAVEPVRMRVGHEGGEEVVYSAGSRCLTCVILNV